MEYLRIALEYITGNKVSDYMFNLNNDLSQLAVSLKDKNRPFHFNEVILEPEFNKLKEGYFLVCNTDLIQYNTGYCEGRNRVYSKREVNEIIKNQESILVR